MKYPSHSIVAFLISASLSLLAFATLITTASAVPNSPESDGDALADLGACLLTRGEGSIVLLVDQSGSMRTTDPENDRFTAGAYLIERFNRFSSESNIKLDMRVAGFAADYTPQGEWTRLAANNVPDLMNSLRNIVDDLKDYDTDYWTALEMARRDITEHTEDGGCRAIAWLTDGDFDIDVRENSAAESEFGASKPWATDRTLRTDAETQAVLEAAKIDFCRSTGLADQIRSSNITLLGIGLTQANPDYGFVRSVILGGGERAAQAANVAQCGEISKPSGSFFEVGNLDALYLAFDSISTPGQTVQKLEVGICQGVLCDEQVLPFVLDDSLGVVHILASADKDSLDAFLLPPNSQTPVPLIAGSSSADGDVVSYSWLTPRTIEIDLDPTRSERWAGQWKLAFVDQSATSKEDTVHANIHLSSNTMIDWPEMESVEFRSGDVVNNVNLRVFSHKNGTSVDLSSLKGRVDIEVSLVDATEKRISIVSTQDKEALNKPFSIDLEDAAIGSGEFVTALTITTADVIGADGSVIPGTTLTPTITRKNVQILPPLNFPTVDNAINFGHLEKSLSATAELQIKGPGCVWVDPSATQVFGAPAEAGRVGVGTHASAVSTCIQVEEGATALLPLTLTTEGFANGGVTGEINVYLAPLGESDKAQFVAIPFNAEMRKPLDLPLTWATFIAALFGGIGCPIVLLYLFKYFGARIPKGVLVSSVLAVDIPESGAGTLRRIEVPITDRNTQYVASSTRRIQVGPYELRTRIGFAPTESGWVEIETRAATVSGSMMRNRRGQAVLPLGVRGNWIAILDHPESPKKVNLLIFARSVGDDAYQQILDDVQSKLVDCVATATDRLPESNEGPAKLEVANFGGRGEQVVNSNPFESMSGAPGSRISPFGATTPMPASDSFSGGWSSDSSADTFGDPTTSDHFASGNHDRLNPFSS